MPAAELALHYPSSIAVDLTDPIAGPAVLIGDQYAPRILRLNLRTRMVTAVVGGGIAGDVRDYCIGDGPASTALIPKPYGMAVAPNGVIFVVDNRSAAVRRISAANATAERFVTTVIGAATSPGDVVQYAVSAAECFRKPLDLPLPLCLVPWPPSDAAVRTAIDSGPDAVRLFVGCQDGVHSFDLARGERKHFAMDLPRTDAVSGMAVDGARLFVVATAQLSCIDLRSGAVTELIPRGGFSPQSSGLFGLFGSYRHDVVTGCVWDGATRSLVMCDNSGHRILRVRGGPL